MGPKRGLVCVCVGVCVVVVVVINRASSWSDTGLTKIDNKDKKFLVALWVNFQELDFGILL